MPTGYTAKLSKGEQSFNEFAMTCARAMGACVMMRDDSFDAPIPERFEPSDYDEKAIEKARKARDDLFKLSLEQCGRKATKAYKERVKYLNEQIVAAAENNTRYIKMRNTVTQWQPPSNDHDGLKKFMLDQLNISMDNDSYYKMELNNLEKKTGEKWLNSELAKVLKDISYHRENHRKEIKRTEGRNKWISELRLSLGE